MTAVNQRKKQGPKIRTRAQRELTRTLLTMALIVTVLALGMLATYLVTEPYLHPTHHPRLIAFFTYMTHFHPRLCRALLWGTILLGCLPQIVPIVLPHYLNWRMRMRGVFSRPKLKTATHLNQPLTVNIPLVLPQAWAALCENFPGMTVRSADIRPAHWELLHKDDDRREMQIALRYTHEALAIKCWRLYPRELRCTIRLRARGVSTVGELIYIAGSAMDYATLYDIITKTNLAIVGMNAPVEHPEESLIEAFPVLAV